MKKGKFISSVSLLLVLFTAAVPLLAASPPSGRNYAECTTPGGTLTTRANLVFAGQKPDQPEPPEYQDYTVTFIPNNGQENIVQTVPAGTVTAPPALQGKEGYEFEGWFIDGHPADFTEPVSANLTFSAKWTPVVNNDPYAVRDDVSYTVEHYQQTLDNEYVLTDSEQLAGRENTLVTADVKSYTGFTENPGHPGRAASGVVSASEPLILRLYYDRNLYKVTIDPGNGQPTVLEVRYGDLLHEPDTNPSRDGAVFHGWVDLDTQAPVDWNEPVTGNRNIAASFLPKDHGGLSGSGSHGSSGGGSGSHSGASSGGSASVPKDQEEAPKDDLPGTILNKKDHIRYISGYPDGTVRPMRNITRGEVAQIIYRLMQPAYRETNFIDTNPYRDIGAAVWCNDAVSTLTRAKLMQGYGDGTFGCNRSITRAEFVTVISRFFTLTGGRECLFTDIDPHWAKAEIEKAASLGYIQGKTRTIFDPNAPLTRAEAAAILNRVLERGTKAEFMLEEMKHWPDNPSGTWYYEDMQEASNGHDYKTENGHEVWAGLAGN